MCKYLSRLGAFVLINAFACVSLYISYWFIDGYNSTYVIFAALALGILGILVLLSTICCLPCNRWCNKPCRKNRVDRYEQVDVSKIEMTNMN